jgi:hypothetical protein
LLNVEIKSDNPPFAMSQISRWRKPHQLKLSRCRSCSACDTVFSVVDWVHGAAGAEEVHVTVYYILSGFSEGGG